MAINVQRLMNPTFLWQTTSDSGTKFGEKGESMYQLEFTISK